MTQYFATDSRPFEEFNIKIKSGQVYDLAPETAASLNGLAPGILEVFVPAKHQPQPKVEAVEEVKEEVAAEPAKEESKEEKKVKAEKPAK
jgi:hypothetical protein